MILAPDQRRYPRVKPPKEVVVAWQSGTHRGVSFVESLGIGGLFVRTRETVPIRGLVQILLDLPVGQVRCKAVVRRVRENHGMAVQIVAMDPSDRARLSQQMKSLIPA
jgi:putative N-acetylmannosamine-6-phosphate epimerase